MDCSTVCVKVGNLRKVYGKEMNLREWVKNPDNLLCCRNGRIFIDGEIFTYPKSKWSNPYKVGKDGNLDEVCKKFEKYITSSYSSSELNQLKGKCLGCFCDQSGKCHVKVLANMVNREKRLIVYLNGQPILKFYVKRRHTIDDISSYFEKYNECQVKYFQGDQEIEYDFDKVDRIVLDCKTYDTIKTL